MSITLQSFQQDQYTATEATRCIQIYIPDDDSYMALLGGLLALAANVANYADPESTQAEGVAAIWYDAYIQSDWEGCVVPIDWKQSRQLVFPETMDSWFGSVVWNQYPSQERAGIWFIPNNASNTNYVKFDRITLRAGSYICRMMGQTMSTAGIATIDVNGTDETTIDMYSAALAINAVKTSGVFTIPADITCPFHIRMKGKNGSASQNSLSFNWIEFDRYAD